MVSMHNLRSRGPEQEQEQSERMATEERRRRTTGNILPRKNNNRSPRRRPMKSVTCNDLLAATELLHELDALADLALVCVLEVRARAAVTGQEDVRRSGLGRILFRTPCLSFSVQPNDPCAPQHLLLPRRHPPSPPHPHSSSAAARPRTGTHVLLESPPVALRVQPNTLRTRLLVVLDVPPLLLDARTPNHGRERLVRRGKVAHWQAAASVLVSGAAVVGGQVGAAPPGIGVVALAGDRGGDEAGGGGEGVAAWRGLGRGGGF